MSALPMFQRVGKAAYKANLDNTVRLLDHLGNPQKNFRSVHIAGTNGKGSVSHFLASVFQEAGYKTGLYTSPHLTDFRERIKINGAMIEKSYVARFISLHRDFLEKLKPSFFEMSVGLCFQYFSERNIDVAIIETGMGGRLDSTNIIAPDLSVITNIGFDHTQFLGDSLEKIAAEKAGIIKPGVPVVIGETQKETINVFTSVAKKNKSEISFADKELFASVESHTLVPPCLTLRTGFDDAEHLFSTPLAGSYQIKNVRTALVSLIQLRKAGYKLHLQAIRQGLANVIENTGLRGRWMVFGEHPAVIMDTGHNAAGLTEISQMLKSLSYSRLHMVIGMVDDKDHIAMLKLLPQNARYYLCTPSVPRGFDSKKLLEKANRARLDANAFNTVEEAYKAARKASKPNDVLFIGGSTFTVADALLLKEFSLAKRNKSKSDNSQMELKF